MDYIISISLVVVIYGFTIYYYGKERKRLMREKIKVKDIASKSVVVPSEENSNEESNDRKDKVEEK